MSLLNIGPGDTLRILRAKCRLMFEELYGLLFPLTQSPIVKTTSAALSTADVTRKGFIVQYTGMGAANFTLPTGAALDAALGVPPIDRSFDFAVINAGNGQVTIVPSVGFTIVGFAKVAKDDSAIFRVRKVIANVFVLYRLA
jgi:hypothetical protein